MIVSSGCGLGRATRFSLGGWLLLSVVVIVLLVALGVTMLMAQSQQSLISVRLEHQTMQVQINGWSPVLKSRKDVDEE